jgi:2-oxoglutarate ferredoxin oxidoreductase subunit alpha
MNSHSISIALSGSGGAGVVTTGQLLLQAAGKAGLFGLMHRSAGPQIRGGESLAMLRLSDREVATQDDAFGLLFALDWKNYSRFDAEVPLSGDSCVFADAKAGDAPSAIAEGDFHLTSLPLTATAQEIGGRANMVLLGRLGRFLDIPAGVMADVAKSHLSSKGKSVLDTSIACIEAGYAEGLEAAAKVPGMAERAADTWLISGNQAAGFGALYAGVRFVAAYPITPASDFLEWLSPRLDSLGGRLAQAEDELASVNMIIGASWSGVPSLTATSGPGLALMTEGLGLAVASETPVTVLDVMRGGPSTGIPTKSEQSDLNIALYGLHGDAPHLVTAPLSVTDCAVTTAWTVGLSEALQVPAIILSDQSLGQSMAIALPPDMPEPVNRKRVELSGDVYARYQQDADDISPMAIPGDAGCMYTADGLEHNEAGIPSAAHEDHLRGLEKRLGKIEGYEFGPLWADLEGEGELLLVTFGSLSGAVREAAARLRSGGRATRTLCIRLLSPLRVDAVTEETRAAGTVLVIEQNHGAQLFTHLRGHGCLPASASSFARPGPLPIRPGEIVDFVNRTSDS